MPPSSRPGTSHCFIAFVMTCACQGADAGPTPIGNGATIEQPWFGERVVCDLGSISSAPLRWDDQDWAVAGACIGGTVAAGIALDRPVQHASQRNRSADLDDWSSHIGVMGSIGSFAVIAGTGLGAWTAGDARLGDAAVDALEASIIAAGVITPLIKATAGRTRPRDAGQDSDSFRLFATGRKSFPSGHATQAFAVASAYAGSYPDHPWVGVLGYATATAVGLSRIEANAHYVSDVVAGAVIGTFVGLTTVRLNAARRDPAGHGRRWMPTDLRIAVVDEGPAAELTWRW